MPKGKKLGAGLGLGDMQQPGAHVGHLRSTFVAALRASCRDVVEELLTVRTAEQAKAWAERHHLATDWIIGVALDSVAAWARSAVERKHLILAHPFAEGELVPEPPAPAPWAPTIETETQFRQRIDAYIKDVRTWATEFGLEPDKERRQLRRDIDAFISYQVREWDLDAVIEEYFDGLTNDASRKALRQTADDLQLILRKQ